MPVETVVVLAVAAAIVAAGVLSLPRGVAAARRRDWTQEATIVVDGEYRPARVELVAGVPAVLRFERREDDPCSERLVCELLPSEQRLAAHAVTTVRFTPLTAGTYRFTCGLGLYLGQLVVRSRAMAREQRESIKPETPSFPGNFRSRSSHRRG